MPAFRWVASWHDGDEIVRRTLDGFPSPDDAARDALASVPTTAAIWVFGPDDAKVATVRAPEDDARPERR